MNDEIKRIHEYVWARHIDGSDHYDHSIDEEEAIRVLDEFYSGIGNRNSPDQVYLGILLFERAFEFPDQQAELFARAKRIFEFYRRVTGEGDWPAVEDRLEDIRSFLGEPESAEPEPAGAATDDGSGAAPAAVAGGETGAPALAEATATTTVAAASPDEAESALSEAAEAPAAEEVAEVVEAEVQAAERAHVEITSAAEEEQRKVEEEARARRMAAEAFIADLEVVEGMCLIPAGTFLFGPDERELFLDAFYIDRAPVTNAEYMRFVRETGYRQPRYAGDERLWKENLPVVGVSFADAQQYARWAGKSLPTELQWEKAARGTDGRHYPWGNDPPGASDARFGLDPVEGMPGEVGHTLRNVSPFGVLGTCGNIWEWTRSPFAPGSEFKVVRGGSYNDPVAMLRLDFRLEAHPKDKCEAIGFRCVKNIHS